MEGRVVSLGNAKFAKQTHFTIIDILDICTPKVKKGKHNSVDYSLTVIHFPFAYLAISIVLEFRKM